MERLTVTRPRSAESEKCLPDGDGLPLWDTLPLYAKFPMVPNPRGSITLCTTTMCMPKHKSLDFEFDLSDPYCHVISNEYQPLHDPHLRHHFSLPKMRRHLQRNGFITSEGKVICNLREFNQYRQYLRKIYLLETARERKLREAESNKSIKCGSNNTEMKNKNTTRGEEVRARLQNMREETKGRVEQEIQEKSERLQRRLQEIKNQKTIQENCRRQENRRRLAFLQQHQNERQRQTKLLVRKWKIKEKQRLERIEEQRRYRLRMQQQKSQETWETRKALQRTRLDKEETAYKREEQRRLLSLTEREQVIQRQRERLKASLDRLRDQARKEYMENEEKHAKRLARRLALANLRSKRSRHGRYRKDRRYHRSLWSLEESLRRLCLSDIPFPGKKSSTQFLEMLNAAIEEAVDIVSDEQMEMTSEEEEVQLRAQQIVDYVIAKVQHEVYPLYLKLREEEEDLSKSGVRFQPTDAIIPPGNRTVDRSQLKPVTEHTLTPVASPYALSKSTDYSCQSVKAKLLENLLTRLIDDLDNNRLTQDELMRLTRCVMTLILSSQEDKTLIVTEDLVKFTLDKILRDLRSGNIAQEDITELTKAIVGREGSSEDDSIISISSNDTQLQQYIEETLQNLTQDVREESPVNDAMLDEWIVSQLREITNDVNNGMLSKQMISEMVERISGDLDNGRDLHDSEDSFRHFLESLINELNGDKGHSLYKIVHAIVSSYHAYKAQSMSEFVEVLILLTTKIQKEIECGGMLESDVDLTKLNCFVRHFSGAVLSQHEIGHYASDIVAAVANDEEIERRAHLIVENVLQEARQKVERASIDDLKMFANVIATSCQDLEMSQESQDSAFVENISHFIVDILKLSWKCVKHGGFNDKDLVEMTQIFDNALQTSNFAPETGLTRNEILIKHIDEVLRSLENGQFNDNELNSIGKSLLSCGNHLLGREAETSLSNHDDINQSLTSTTIADDVVNHLINSLQNEINSGEMTKDSIKELALCILNSKTSQNSVDTVIESVSRQKHTSPCDSQLAEDFVRYTIDDIVRDLESGFLDSEGLSSMAVSIMSALSTTASEMDAQRFEATVNDIIRVLKNDDIPPYDIKKVFALIMENYSSQMFREPFPNSQATTSDSVLAESLIKETLQKVERDIQSGQLSNEDINFMMNDVIGISMVKYKTPGDVVNLTLAILQQLVFDISASRISADDVVNFLKSIGNTFDVDSNACISSIRKEIKIVMADIRQKRSKSVYLKNILSAFNKSENLSLRNISPEKNPVQALDHVLKNINSDILTNFVRMTVCSVMSDLSVKGSWRQVVHEKDVSEYDLQTASSDIANKVVANLMEKMDQAIQTGSKLSSNDSIVMSSNDVHDWNRISISSIPSKEISGLILDTLNNIVSNMRLEKSIVKDTETQGNEAQIVTSQLIQDFVLEKLQEIVESMQDNLNFDGNIPPTDNEMRQESEPSAIIGMDNKSAKKLVSESLKSVVSEILVESGRTRTEMSHKTVSTGSLEAEAIVVDALHGILNEFEEEGTAVSDDKTKENLLVAMNGIMRDFKDYDKSDCRLALEQLFESSLPCDKMSVTEISEYIETTLNTIVKSIENDVIKAAEVFRLTGSSPIDCSASYVKQIAEAEKGNVRALTQLTAQVLDIHDDVSVDSKQMGSECSLEAKLSSEIGEIAKEIVSQTITNIKERKLSDDEIVDLATALCASDVNEETTDRDIEDFVLCVLEQELRLLSSVGMDREGVVMLTSKLSQSARQNSQTDTNVNRVPSTEIAELVKDTLSKIAQSLSHVDEDSQPVGSEEKRDVTSVDDNISIGSSNPQYVTGSSTNVNPNALRKQLSVKSLQETSGPAKKSAPVAKIHSLTNVTTSHKCNTLIQRPRVNQREDLQKNQMKKVPVLGKSPGKRSEARHTYFRIKDSLNAGPKHSQDEELASSKPAAFKKSPNTVVNGSQGSNTWKRQNNFRQVLPKVYPSNNQVILKKQGNKITSLYQNNSQNPKVNRSRDQIQNSIRPILTPSARVIPPIDVEHHTTPEHHTIPEHHTTPEQVRSLCGSHRLRVSAVARIPCDD